MSCDLHRLHCKREYSDAKKLRHRNDKSNRPIRECIEIEVIKRYVRVYQTLTLENQLWKSGRKIVVRVEKSSPVRLTGHVYGSIKICTFNVYFYYGPF